MRVKETIREYGHTIGSVANVIGVNRASLSQSISGNPTVETLRKVASVLGCPITDFFKDEKASGNVDAIIAFNGEIYKAESVDELNSVVSRINKINNNEDHTD